MSWCSVCLESQVTLTVPLVQYRREFADPFWNSQEQNMLTYIFMLMTSWAIVCDVYYLEPTTIGVSNVQLASIRLGVAGGK